MFKILDEACTPTRGTKYSAAIDLRSREDITIGAGETVLVPLGVKIDFDKLKPLLQEKLSFFNVASFGTLNKETIFEQFLKSHYLQLMLRSGLCKKGLILPNGVGVIDLDYQDEIMMIIHRPIKRVNVFGDVADEMLGNEEVLTDIKVVLTSDFKIKKGDRVGQITLLEHKSYLFGVDSDEVRSGGFGSTGSK